MGMRGIVCGVVLAWASGSWAQEDPYALTEGEEAMRALLCVNESPAARVEPMERCRHEAPRRMGLLIAAMGKPFGDEDGKPKLSPEDEARGRCLFVAAGLALVDPRDPRFPGWRSSVHQICCPHLGTSCPALGVDWQNKKGNAILSRLYFCAYATESPEEQRACASGLADLLEPTAKALAKLGQLPSEQAHQASAEMCRLSLLLLTVAGPLDEKGKASAEAIRRTCCVEHKQTRLCEAGAR